MNRVKRTRRVGFTLVELLVVIGIIALLISILIPTLAKAKEAANRTKCLSNLRMIGMAAVMYCGDNKGFFPAGGREQYVEDFIYWQQPNTYWNPGLFTLASPRSLDNGKLVPYMGRHFVAANWICPSDDPKVRPNTPTPPFYSYSYDMNFLLSSKQNLHNDGGAFDWLHDQCVKLPRIHNPTSCISFLEETSSTINDGYMALVNIPAGAASGGNQDISQVSWQSGGHDMLAVRHDSNVHYPDNVYVAGKDDLPAPDNGIGLPNSKAKGCAAFCDGHADYVTRAFAQSPRQRHWDPTAP